MARNIIPRIALTTALGIGMTLITAPDVQAGGTGVGGFEPGFVITTPGPTQVTPLPGDTPDLLVANPVGTAFVTQTVTDTYALCAQLTQKEYVVDCLGERIQALANSMPDTGDYSAAKEVLADTAVKLRSVAQNNRSTTKRPARVTARVRNQTVTTAPLTPVRTEAVESSIAQAVAILEEAETRLLRSTANSGRRMVHYQQMAVAVGSNKILLRAT